MSDGEDVLFRAKGTTIRATQQARFDSWFRDRRWRVLTERTGQRVSDDGDIVTYDRGECWVSKGAYFQTPLGHRGRHGVVIREVSPESGEDLDRAVDAVFGHRALRQAAEAYQSVTGLEEPRDHPPAPG